MRIAQSCDIATNWNIAKEVSNCKSRILPGGKSMVDKRMGTFDAEGFYEALDATRQSKSLNWRQVAEEAGISASTLTRMAQGKRPDVDGLAALVAWSGLEVDRFVKKPGGQRKPEPLAVISTYLRSDKQLSAQSAIALDGIIKAAYEQLRKTK